LDHGGAEAAGKEPLRSPSNSTVGVVRTSGVIVAGRRTRNPEWTTTVDRSLDDRTLDELDRALRPRPTVWDTIALPSLRNLTFALLLGVLGAALVAAASLGRSPVYTTSTTLLIDQPGVVATSDVGTIQKLNALRQKYAALIPTAPIADEVARALGVTREHVARSVVGFAPGESLVLVVSARSADRTDAMKLADAVGTQLGRYVDDEMTRNGVPADKRITLTSVDPARTAVKLSPTTGQAFTAAMFAGLVAIAGAYVVLQLATAGRRLPR
jgi:capsular polysaccharide biosynthesis protein